MYKEAVALLDKKWIPEEREVVSRLVNSLKYSYMIPGVLKKDIAACIKICIRLKDELESKEDAPVMCRRNSV